MVNSTGYSILYHAGYWFDISSLYGVNNFLNNQPFWSFFSKFFTKFPQTWSYRPHYSWVCVFHFHGIMRVMYIHVTEFKPYHVTCIVMVVTVYNKVYLV